MGGPAVRRSGGPAVRRSGGPAVRRSRARPADPAIPGGSRNLRSCVTDATLRTRVTRKRRFPRRADGEGRSGGQGLEQVDGRFDVGQPVEGSAGRSGGLLVPVVGEEILGG